MHYIEQAEILLSQSKYKEAEKRLRLHLTEDVNNAIAYSLLAYTLYKQNRNEEVIPLAQKAIGLDPTSDYSHYILGLLIYKLDKGIKDAEYSIKQAISLDPDSPQYYNVLALIKHDQRKFKEAEEIIDKALELDPFDNSCKNTKSILLRRLGKNDEADEIISEALNDDPLDDMNFASKGWVTLEKGNAKESFEYFKEALKINPMNEYAKSGMVNALKVKNPLFKVFFRFYQWCSRQSSRNLWFFIIGIWVLIQVINKVSRNYPKIEPYADIIIYSYIGFVFLTWSINPIFNMFLRFNRYGKYALDKGEKIASNIVFILFALALIQYLLFLSPTIYPDIGALGTLFMVIPVSGTYSNYETKSFKKLMNYTLILAALLILSVVFVYIPVFDPVKTFNIFIFGFIGFSFYSNYTGRG